MIAEEAAGATPEDESANRTPPESTLVPPPELAISSQLLQDTPPELVPGGLDAGEIGVRRIDPPTAKLPDEAKGESIPGAIEGGLSGQAPIALEATRSGFVDAVPLFSDAAGPSSTSPLATEAARTAPADDPAFAISVLGALTPRELAVLDWLRQGKSNKQIARELNMSEATVKVHVRHIMRKMGLANRTQVALLAASLTRK
ncbi:LuxR C-terminal-related transcriptional regulator [Inquilinus limosus]